MAKIDSFIDEDIEEFGRIIDALERAGVKLSEILTEAQCHLIREIEVANGQVS